MAANPPTEAPRRVAVILGAGHSGRRLLELLLPLLTHDRNIEMQGVFLEEAELQHAAELPFVKELCRVTFSVREFTSDQFERTLQLRMRAAQRALTVLARRAGVQHSFRNVRGPALRLLLETASLSDITIFEPVRALAPPAVDPGRRPSRPRRVVAAFDSLSSGRMVLQAAVRLAESDARRLSVLVPPALAGDQAGLGGLLRELLPGQPVRVRVVTPDLSAASLVEAARAEGAALFVLALGGDLLESGRLQFLREKLPCPICLVRQWGGSSDSVKS